jgi:hypothetical protein
VQIGLGGGLTVTATERWLSEVRSGSAFIGGAAQGGAAVVLAQVQLINPAGSGVTVLVRSILVSSDAACRIQIGKWDTPLPTLEHQGRNLLAGAAAGVAAVRRDSAALPGADFGFNAYLATAVPLFPVPEWFYELGAGEGVIVLSASANVGVSASFAWLEL